MAQNSQHNRKIDFLSIDCESDYFNTQAQVAIRLKRTFTDTMPASALSGSAGVAGLFSRRQYFKPIVDYGVSTHPTGSTVVDPSGAARRILDGRIDYFASSSLDSYKNGVEITQDKHWTAGIVKITAGTPGHLHDPMRFGDSGVAILSNDQYVEIDVFDPVAYVDSGGDPSRFTYPIITNDANQADNAVMDGIIEPFAIRPIIGGFSIDFPHEAHSVWGGFGSGNEDMRRASDSVVSVDRFEPTRTNAAPFLDATFEMTIDSVVVGSPMGYFITDENALLPFEDSIPARNVFNTSAYEPDMSAVLLVLSSSRVGGETYVSDRQRSATCGFVYDGAYAGTDSIAYGGLLF